jgi:hypothetical protein
VVVFGLLHSKVFFFVSPLVSSWVYFGIPLSVNFHFSFHRIVLNDW